MIIHKTPKIGKINNMLIQDTYIYGFMRAAWEVFPRGHELGVMEASAGSQRALEGQDFRDLPLE